MKKAVSFAAVLVFFLLTASTALAAGFQYKDQLKGTEIQIFQEIEKNITGKTPSFSIGFSSPMHYDDEPHAKLGVREAVLRAYEAFYRDHPEVFWVTKEGGVNLEPEVKADGSGFNITGTTVTTAFSDAGAIDAKRAELEKAVASILSQASGTDYDKIKLFHDKIIEMCSYDEAAQSRPSAYPDAYESYGALVSGKAVCEGYAKAFKLLCDRSGIPCVLVGGTANSGEHMWNYVMLGNMWYLIDLTFDDPIGGEPTDSYFLKGEETTAADHHPEGSFIEQFDSGFIDPSLSRTDYVPGKSPVSSSSPGSSSSSETEAEKPFCSVIYASFGGGHCYVTFTGVGTAVDNGQQVLSGMALSVFAQPAAGYRLEGITIDMGGEARTETKSSFRFVLRDDCAISANFVPA